MPEQTLDLGAYLAQLEAQRQYINIQIAGVRAALGLPAEDGSATQLGGGITPTGTVSTARHGPSGSIRPDEFFRMSIPEAIRRYLEIRKAPQTPKEIEEGVRAGGILSDAKHFYANVFTALKRLRKQGLVVNTKRGGWGLAEWYAGRSGTGAETKPKTKSKKARAAKATKPSRKPKSASKAANPASKQASSYRAFVGEQMRVGKTMKEAAEMWRKKNAPA